MAFTTPRTWVSGELVTDTMMNTHVRDNIRYLAGLDGPVALSSTLQTTGFLAQGAVPNIWLDEAGVIGGRILVNGQALQVQTRAAGFGASIATPVFFDLNAAANSLRLTTTGLALGGATSLNRLDVFGAGAFGSYAGANAAPTGGMIASGPIGQGYASPAANTICTIGRFGAGTNAPQSALDIRDSIGGMIHVALNIVNSNEVVVLPNGTVTTAVIAFGLTKVGSGSSGQISPTPLVESGTTNATFYSLNAGADRIGITTTAGSVRLTRTAGSLNHRMWVVLGWC